MKKILIGVVVVLVVAGVAYVLITGNGAAPQVPGTEQVTGTPGGIPPQSKLIGDAFSVDLPSGWVETEPVEGTTAMAANADVSTDDPAAVQVGFHSYIAVVHDTMEAQQGIADYAKAVQHELTQAIPGVTFANEQDTTIGDRFARLFEVSMSQEGIDFTVLMAVISGRTGNDVWVLSVNTASATWGTYRDTFYLVVRSFVVKL
jgi:hypothetical protein